MRNLLLTIAVLGIASCSNVEELERAGANIGEIVGGTATAEYPATVALMASNHTFRGQVFCTGTLIARRAVLSAAHCMDPAYVMFGTDPEADGARFVAVSEYVRNENYLEMDVEGIEHDIAIAILAEDAPSDVPVIELSAVTPTLGTMVQWVGFGHTAYGADDKGIKRTVGYPVSDFLGRLVGTANASCRADSGGSIYVMEGGTLKLAGSDRGSLSMCVGNSYFVPAALYIDWFNTTIDAHGGRGSPTVEDAGVPEADAGATDAGLSTDDAGAVVADDASIVDGDASTPVIPVDRGGCSVVASRRSSLSWFAFVFALLGLARVRRQIHRH